MKTSLEIRYVLQGATVKLWSSFFLVTRTMLVLFVLRFYHPDRTDKINRLIHYSRSKMAVKICMSCQKADVCIKLFRVTAGNIYSFRIRSKETLPIMYPKYPVLDMIQRILLRWGSFGSIIRFWILVKKRNIRFRIKVRSWILVKKRTLNTLEARHKMLESA